MILVETQVVEPKCHTSVSKLNTTKFCTYSIVEMLVVLFVPKRDQSYNSETARLALANAQHSVQYNIEHIKLQIN